MTNPAMYDVVDTKRGVRKTYTEALIGRGDIFDEKRPKTRSATTRANWNGFSTTSGKWRCTECNRALRWSPTRCSLRGSTPRWTRHCSPASATHSSPSPEGFTAHPRVTPVLEKAPGHGLRRARSTGRSASLLAFGFAGCRGQIGAAVGARHQAGHLLPATFGDHRSPHRRRVHSVCSCLATDRDGHPDRWQVHGLRLAAVGVRRRRLRVRLQRSANPDALVLWEGQFGDFVQRCTVDHRRVHQLRRGEVGAIVQRGAAAAARTRRAGPRPHLRPASNASCSCGRRVR